MSLRLYQQTLQITIAHVAHNGDQRVRPDPSAGFPGLTPPHSRLPWLHARGCLLRARQHAGRGASIAKNSRAGAGSSGAGRQDMRRPGGEPEVMDRTTTKRRAAQFLTMTIAVLGVAELVSVRVRQSVYWRARHAGAKAYPGGADLTGRTSRERAWPARMRPAPAWPEPICTAPTGRERISGARGWGRSQPTAVPAPAGPVARGSNPDRVV
jgi:hypothetical protein